jgi:hypothetical protein
MKNNMKKHNAQIKFDFFKHKEDRDYKSMSLQYAMLVGLIEGDG